MRDHSSGKFDPIVWAIALVIVIVFSTVSYRVVKSCEPSSFELLNNLKVDLGGCNIDTGEANFEPKPKSCRDKSHGIESYQRAFNVDRTSPWMGGGFSQDPWCNQVIRELRGQYPEGKFEVLSKSETSHTTCTPLNCPEYQYFCSVRVSTDPIYVEKYSSACK